MTENRIYVIEDRVHAEVVSELGSEEQAIIELRRISTLPWGIAPNKPPCTSGLECSRRFEIVEYEISSIPYKQLKRKLMLEIDKAGFVWQSQTF